VWCFDLHHFAEVFFFSKGIILWELLTSQMPFYGFRFDWQIAEAVVEGKRPHTPSPSPSSPSSSPSVDSLVSSYMSIMQESWSSVPSERPSFDEILPRLESLSKDL
jgi:hypothetical protein